MRIALIGAGERGIIYSQYAHEQLGYTISAVADPNPQRIQLARDLFSIEESQCFLDGCDLIAQVKDIDAVIIASMDRDHFRHTMAALECGFDILLEKPISPDARECLAIRERAEQTGCNVTVCHVLRYAPFFIRVKEILDSGEIGNIVAIDHTENIGNFHIAHSFVRGNWRNSKQSSPIVMQKSCHDMDILLWLTQSSAKSIASVGSLSYFRAEHAPQGSAERCLDCAVAENCRYEARKAYLPTMGAWPSRVLTADQTEAGLMKAFREGPYGRCVFRCDNDVCDHQSTVIEFENGVSATFTLCGMTNEMHRTIHVMCEDGELFGDDLTGVIRVVKFRSNQADAFEESVFVVGTVSGNHGGGDEGLVNDFAAKLVQPDAMESRSSIRNSIESHLMACAAEESRLTGQTISMRAFEDRFLERDC
ncbi:MAG TPA: Gfo/Idh/MocA family oxidoreductase [Clostridia bacterium]|nr:Gfo/Idh/MocA family oxidoreductase [Clostridia bacterium]